MLINSQSYNTALFTDTTTPNNSGIIKNPVSNVAAANSCVQCQTQKGGNILKKISNKIISKKYISSIYKRMRGKKQNTLKTKRKLRKKYSRKNRKRGQKGGYSQFLSNVPLTQGYGIGGELSKYDSALANGNISNVYNECAKVSR